MHAIGENCFTNNMISSECDVTHFCFRVWLKIKRRISDNICPCLFALDSNDAHLSSTDFLTEPITQ